MYITLYNLFAHSSSTFLLILFIKCTVYRPAHFILLHTLFIFLFFILICLFFYFIFYTYIYVYSLVFVLHIIALSTERTWLTCHCWLYSVEFCMWQIQILNLNEAPAEEKQKIELSQNIPKPSQIIY